ncbi:MAG TPA: ATP-binding protein [Ramlibacter sp.]|uniref:ATP-binding protein n=1 Tax=Ramlibacter sp. TaxID=1917967 RepID=UPI002D564274|nr:ATP-binding protein [Ramlibacter sp.]HZY20258.1 ATP-binding protein [Ramlibacter sp.]
MREEELELPAAMAEVAAATQKLRGLLPDWLDDDGRDAIELAVAEALTNVVKHGYGGDSVETVRLRLLERPGGLEIELLDRGRPIPDGRLEQADETTFMFDPTDLANLPENGLGLALIKAAFDEVRYRTRRGVNRLQLVRRF